MGRSLRLLLLLLAAVSGISRVVAADDAALTKYFNGLRQRGLLVIAEDHAVRQLARSDLDEVQRRQLAIQLAETLIAHAENSTPAQQAELFDTAHKYVADELKSNTASPDSILRLRFTQALLSLRQVELQWWEMELAGETSTVAFAKQVDQVILQFRQVLAEKNVNSSIRLPGEFDEEVAEALQQSLLLRIAVAVDLVDRTGAIITASEECESAARQRSQRGISRNAKLNLVRISRLREEYAQALTALEALEKIAAPESFRDELVAEKARVYLKMKQYDKALEVLTEALRGRSYIPAEFHALTVDVLCGAAEVASSKGQTELQADLLKQARQEVASTYGKWYRRAASVLSTTEENLRYGPRLSPLVKKGRQAYSSGDFDSAAETFQQAATVAISEGRMDDAVEFSMTRGSIQLQKGDAPSAARTFREMYGRAPEHQRAAEVHLLLCYALGRVYGDAGSAEARDAYINALELHTTTFPNSPTRNEAVWLLGLLWEQEEKSDQAIRWLLQVAVGHKHYDAAILKVVAIDRKELERLSDDATAISQRQLEARKRLEKIMYDFPLPPEGWNLTQSQIGLQGSHILIAGSTPQFNDADILLTRVVDSARIATYVSQGRNQEVDPRWESLANAARQLQIVVFAGAGKILEARRVLGELESAQPAKLLAILNGLADASQNLPEDQRKQVGRLQQEMSARLEQRRSALNVEQQLELDRIIAQSYVASGDLIEAAHIYERLFKENPRDKPLAIEIARLYTQHGEPSDLATAQKYWTSMEQAEVAGSVPWLEARIEVLKLMQQLGKNEEARKLLGVTRILYPKLGNPQLKKQFDALSAQLGK
ncbi:MAG: tetratricopeptide repeat protein [Planctomycetaceae bacterium]|nr:tetratricopeptide repeat protein [Planctomycetaceae bacterium]